MNKYICIFLLSLVVLSYGQNITLLDTLIQNDVQASEFLINQKNVDVTMTNREGFTPLHFVSDIRLASLLLEKGADICATNQAGSTPLHWAVSRDKLDIVEFLIDNGANVDAVDNLGNTPLHLSVNASEDIMMLLLKSGANVDIANKAGSVPLIPSLEHDRFVHTRYLLLAGAKDIANTNGLKPSMLDSLVKKESLKETLIVGLLPFPIITEIFKENYSVAIEMIEDLEFIDEIDLNGNTPLHWAFKKKNYEISKLLIQKGVYYGDVNNDDESSVDILLQTKDKEFIKDMKDYLKENSDYIEGYNYGSKYHRYNYKSTDV